MIAIFQANEARGGDGRCYGEGGGWQARGEVGRHQARLTLEELMFQGTNVRGTNVRRAYVLGGADVLYPPRLDQNSNFNCFFSSSTCVFYIEVRKKQNGGDVYFFANDVW